MTCHCPSCHQEAEMIGRVSCSTEPHGETHVDEYAECARCHHTFDWDEIADSLAAEEFGALAEVDVREGSIQ